MKVREVLSSNHDSPETAYIIPDYPFGRTLRCYKRIWVETAQKGSKKGLQRVVYQTTTKSFNSDYTDNKNLLPPVKASFMWNKQKTGNYGIMCILYIDDETGYVEISGLSQFCLKTELTEFKNRFWDFLDEEQLRRVSMINPY